MPLPDNPPPTTTSTTCGYTLWPRTWRVGRSNVVKEFQSPPCLRCRPPVGQTLDAICVSLEPQEGQGGECSNEEQSTRRPVLFNHRTHSINFMLLTLWEHIKLYWTKRHQSSSIRWLQQIANSHPRFLRVLCKYSLIWIISACSLNVWYVALFSYYTDQVHLFFIAMRIWNKDTCESKCIQWHNHEGNRIFLPQLEKKSKRGKDPQVPLWPSYLHCSRSFLCQEPDDCWGD